MVEMKRAGIPLLATAVVIGCGSPADKPGAAIKLVSEPPAKTTTRDMRKADEMKPTLPEALEAELAAIRDDPVESVGFGLKAYLPYEPTGAQSLMNSDDPAVTKRLLAEASGAGDTAYRLAVLHVLGKRTDATVDAALIQLLSDDALRATTAYLLGRVGYKGYLPRTRDVATVQTALRAHVKDNTTFTDPFYQKTYRTQDFVIAAYIRVTGPSRFRFADPSLEDLIGLGLPEFSDDARADLLAQIERGYVNQNHASQ